MRYFFAANSYNVPLNVYKFDVKSGIEKAWNVTEWGNTDKVSRFLTRGDGWLDEVNEVTAKATFPDAFKERGNSNAE